MAVHTALSERRSVCVIRQTLPLPGEPPKASIAVQRHATVRIYTEMLNHQGSTIPTCATYNPAHSTPLSNRSSIAITDEASPFALRSTRNRPRTAMRRGAASCRAVLCGCPRCGGDGRGGRCRHRRAVMDGRAPPTRQPERGWASPAAGGRGRRGCPDAGHAIGRLSASAVRRADVCPLGRADVRCPTRPVSTRPVSTRPARSWCPDGHASGHRGPGVRAVRTALDPGMRRCGGAAHVRARRLRYVAVVGEWLGRRCPELGSGGEGMVVGSAVPGSDRVDGRPAAGMDPRRLRRRARRRADMGAGPAQGAGRLAGGTSRSSCSHVALQVRPGPVAGVMAGWAGRC
jgi:hypothetical protein